MTAPFRDRATMRWRRLRSRWGPILARARCRFLEHGRRGYIYFAEVGVECWRCGARFRDMVDAGSVEASVASLKRIREEDRRREQDDPTLTLSELHERMRRRRMARW